MVFEYPRGTRRCRIHIKKKARNAFPWPRFGELCGACPRRFSSRGIRSSTRSAYATQLLIKLLSAFYMFDVQEQLRMFRDSQSSGGASLGVSAEEAAKKTLKLPALLS
jgi:hypothetical protein